MGNSCGTTSLGGHSTFFTENEDTETTDDDEFSVFLQNNVGDKLVRQGSLFLKQNDSATSKLRIMPVPMRSVHTSRGVVTPPTVPLTPLTPPSNAYSDMDSSNEGSTPSHDRDPPGECTPPLFDRLAPSSLQVDCNDSAARSCASASPMDDQNLNFPTPFFSSTYSSPISRVGRNTKWSGRSYGSAESLLSFQRRLYFWENHNSERFSIPVSPISVKAKASSARNIWS